MPPRIPLPLSLSLPRASASSGSTTHRPASWRRAAAAARPLHATRAVTAEKKEDALHPNPSVAANTDPQARVAADETAPHVSEEAAALAKVRGEGGPSVESGVPVAETVQHDPAAIKNLPKVMRDALKTPSQKRDFSTLARRLQALDLASTDRQVPFTHLDDAGALVTTPATLPAGAQTPAQLAAGEIEINDATARAIADGLLPEPGEARAQAAVAARAALRFGAPVVAGRTLNVRKGRYEGIVEQITNLLIKDGKKARAQRFMQDIINHLRSSPAPHAPTRPLVAGTPPVAQLPYQPALYLQAAIDSVAPVLYIKTFKGAGGGGASVLVPRPYALRPRRRTAIMWLIEAARKKAGGTAPFAKRFADEVVAVVEGRSAVWEKRSGVHRIAISARTTLSAPRKINRNRL